MWVFLFDASPFSSVCQYVRVLLLLFTWYLVLGNLWYIVGVFQTKMKQAFGALDGNQDGQILMSELRELLRQMGEMPSEKNLQVGSLLLFNAFRSTKYRERSMTGGGVLGGLV